MSDSRPSDLGPEIADRPKRDQAGGACRTGDRTCRDAGVLPAAAGRRPDAAS